MKKSHVLFMLCAALSSSLYAADAAKVNLVQEETPSEPTPEQDNESSDSSTHATSVVAIAEAPPQTKKVEAFTGKTIKNRVRLRLQPHLDSPILRELQRDEFFVVTGTVDDFYAVLPSPKLKAYIFRTYVLDGVVEGNRVNVRLEPETTAPIICQLNSGDTVKGVISSQNNKWLEIAMPENVRFYVAKEYVSPAGDAKLYDAIEKKRSETEHKLATIEAQMQQELSKQFKDIKLAPLAEQLNQIISGNAEMPRQKEKAEALLKIMQEAYLQKSIANKQTSQVADDEADDTENQKEPPKKATHKLPEPDETSIPLTANDNSKPGDIATWKAREQELIKQAISKGEIATEDQFYSLDQNDITELKGILKPNSRFVKNMPGDFLLINPQTELPLAYLYSTKVDLHKFLGKEVSLTASERPNNNFAYPAFFVLEVNQK
jgi:hypothetical protein